MKAAVIVTSHDYPPIPLRHFDWSAWVDGTESEDMVLGHGATEAAAIADLIEQLDEADAK
jgi:hypothetical protein